MLPLNAAPVLVDRRIPPSLRGRRWGSGRRGARCLQNTKDHPATRESTGVCDRFEHIQAHCCPDSSRKSQVHVCIHQSGLPAALPWTECSLWGPVKWSTGHICPPQIEAETPAAASVHPLLTNPVKMSAQMCELKLRQRIYRHIVELRYIHLPG